MKFGEKLKKARSDAGYTQEELSEKICVSRSAIAKWEADKGMPDINNIKAISSLLDISIDYLLDDNKELSFDIIKYPIDLNEYSIFKKKKQKDLALIEKFPDAEIYTLIATEKKTKIENVIDELITLFSPFVDIISFTKSINNLDNEFYFVIDNNKQYLVLVTSDFIQVQEFHNKIEKNKFTMGNYKFLLCKHDINYKR